MHYKSICISGSKGIGQFFSISTHKLAFGPECCNSQNKAVLLKGRYRADKFFMASISLFPEVNQTFES